MRTLGGALTCTFMGLRGVEPLTSRLSGGSVNGSDSGKYSDFKAIPHDLHGIQIHESDGFGTGSGTGSGTAHANTLRRSCFTQDAC